MASAASYSSESAGPSRSSGSGEKGKRRKRDPTPGPSTSSTSKTVEKKRTRHHRHHGRVRSRSSRRHHRSERRRRETSEKVHREDIPRERSHRARRAAKAAQASSTSTEKYKFSHILVKHVGSRWPFDQNNIPIKRSKDEAMNFVYELHEKILNDLISFSDAAMAFSNCNSAQYEGDIQSQFKSGKMLNSFKNTAIALAPGEVSNVVETKAGYHILQRPSKTVEKKRTRHHRHHGRVRSRSSRRHHRSERRHHRSERRRRETREKVHREDIPRERSHRARRAAKAAQASSTSTENYKFSHILVKHVGSRRPFDQNNIPIKRSKDEAMNFVYELHEKILNDLISFSDAAMAFSNCNSAQYEGDIQSQFKSGKMLNSFKNTAIALAPGEVSNVVETQAGYHILLRRE